MTNLSRTSLHRRLPATVFACAVALTAPLAAGRGQAHGGVDDEKPEPAAASAAPLSGATQTEIELHLEDLSQGAAGTSAPLAGARVRGFLKHDDGDLLSRLTAIPEKTPGYYLVRFKNDAPTYRFGEAGHYVLELSVQPSQGDAFNAVAKLDLPAAAPPIAPLWKRALLPLALAAAIVLILLLLRRRFGRHPGSKPVVGVAASLLFLVSVGLSQGSGDARAHGGVDDEKPEPASGPASSASLAPNIQPGEASTTTTSGKVRVTVIARTSLAPPETLAPGEVVLPAQTAALLNIKTAPVELASLTTGIDFNGQIAANPNGIVHVASLVPGRVTRLAVGQGDRVRKGQVLAIVESRAVGEAQSAYQQAAARFQNAQSNFQVVQQQARAGVFSRAPLEAAEKTEADALGDARTQDAAVTQARVALDNATRLARVGNFANPALEAAHNQAAQSERELKTAQAALSNAQAAVVSAQAELERRQKLASTGAYVARPVQDAQRSLVSAQSARATAQSEVATTRANLNRAKSLEAEGLVSQRDMEAAQQAADAAVARLQTAQSDETTASQELTRQQQLAASGVNSVAEVQQAQAALANAQADVRTRAAEVARAAEGQRLAAISLQRESAIFGEGIANRREISIARANLQTAQASLFKARQTLAVASSSLAREQNIFRENLNNTAQIQAARAGFVQASADLGAARNALALLKSAPGGNVSIPVRAPIDGIVQNRDAAVGELIQADAPLLTIVNLGDVALEAALFESDVARVRLGAKVTVTTDAEPGRSYTGRIIFVGSQLDPATRTLTARAIIANPGALRPGMFAKGQIETGVTAPSLTVPAGAVLDDGAAQVVFVDEGGKYARREVLVGAQSGGRIAIKAGLKQGEMVVSEGGAALRAQAARGS